MIVFREAKAIRSDGATIQASKTEAFISFAKKQVNLGFTSFEVSAGQHIAHFYRSKEEAKQVYIAFIQEGLRNGDTCICKLGPDLTEQQIIGSLQLSGIDTERALDSTQLLLDSDSSKSLQRGALEFVLDRIPGHRILRWAGDVTCATNGYSYPALHATTGETFPAVFLCQYDLTRLSGSSLMDAQVRHPVWIINDVVHNNPMIVAREEIDRLRAKLEHEHLHQKEEIHIGRHFKNIVGQSLGIRRVLKAVETVAPTDAGVLLYGETGTGKELVVQSIHVLSARQGKPLIKVNCAALPPGLMESELFGHEKGSFTGAFTRKPGRFEIANGGTIFLDEIGDLQLDLQAKLLRVLQEGEFERVGSCQTIQVDVRVIAATNRNLEKAIYEGKFRADLYYRLNVFPIKIPSLRERKEDIPLLVKYFVMKYGAKFRKNIERIPQTTLDALLAYSWPGNIRELENLIERAVIMCQSTELEPGKWLPQPGAMIAESRIPTMEELEKDHILEVLQMTSWRVSGERGAAKLLGMKPTTLEARMKKLGINRY